MRHSLIRYVIQLLTQQYPITRLVPNPKPLSSPRMAATPSINHAVPQNIGTHPLIMIHISCPPPLTTKKPKQNNPTILPPRAPPPPGRPLPLQLNRRHSRITPPPPNNGMPLAGIIRRSASPRQFQSPYLRIQLRFGRLYHGEWCRDLEGGGEGGGGGGWPRVFFEFGFGGVRGF